MDCEEVSPMTRARATERAGGTAEPGRTRCRGPRSGSEAEIGPLHLRRLEELRTRPLGHDVARLEDVAAVRHFERLARVLLHEQDRDAAGVDVPDDREAQLDEDRRDA